MTLDFISNTKAEALKIRRTNALWLTFMGAGFIPLVNCIKLIARPDVFASKMQSDPWGVLINDNWAVAALCLLPLYTILVISLVVQIEYGNNTWKQVYTTPRSYADIFFSKFLVINLLIFACFVTFTLLIVLSGYALYAINPDYPFLSNPVPWTFLAALAQKMYVSIAGIVAIQYCLSLAVRNFITPVGIGIGLLITGFMIRQWEYIIYYPYMHSIVVYFRNPGMGSGAADKAMLTSTLAWGLMLVGGFYNMCSRRDKG